MSTLKRKSSVALITGIIVMLLLIPIWYVTLIPYLIGWGFESIDSTTTLEGFLGKEGYMKFLNSTIALGFESINSTTTMEGRIGGNGLFSMYQVYKLNMSMIAHAYTENVRGDNIVMKIDQITIRTDTVRLKNTTRIDLTNPVDTEWAAVSEADKGKKYRLLSWKDNTDGKLGSLDRINMNITVPAFNITVGPRWCDVQEVEYGTICYMNVINQTLPEFSSNMTYVFNKLTLKFVPDAPEEYPDANRTGYGATLYPPHLEERENKSITDVWIDSLNTTGTLEYVGNETKDGVTLYRYFLNKTITSLRDHGNFTRTSTRTMLIEPLMGAPAYIENETYSEGLTNKTGGPPFPLIFMTYKFSNQSIADGLENAKDAYDGRKYLEFLYDVTPISISAHAYTEGVKGNNIIMKIEQNMTRTDTGEILEDFSGNMTNVFNKFTRKHVPDAPQADINRTGYGAALYPSHLKAGENISDVWVDSLNTTGTLQYVGKEKKDGITLYRYFMNEKISKMMSLPSPMGSRNCTLASTETILIEPLMGAPAYIENQTFSFNLTRPSEPDIPFVYMTYKFSNESITDGLANAKTAHDSMQLLGLYIPTIFGVIAIILTVGLAFNVRRLKRKKPPRPETQSPASRKP